MRKTLSMTLISTPLLFGLSHIQAQEITRPGEEQPKPIDLTPSNSSNASRSPTILPKSSIPSNLQGCYIIKGDSGPGFILKNNNIEYLCGEGNCRNFGTLSKIKVSSTKEFVADTVWTHYELDSKASSHKAIYNLTGEYKGNFGIKKIGNKIFITKKSSNYIHKSHKNDYDYTGSYGDLAITAEEAYKTQCDEFITNELTHEFRTK